MSRRRESCGIVKRNLRAQSSQGGKTIECTAVKVVPAECIGGALSNSALAACGGAVNRNDGDCHSFILLFVQLTADWVRPWRCAKVFIKSANFCTPSIGMALYMEARMPPTAR